MSQGDITRLNRMYKCTIAEIETPETPPPDKQVIDKPTENQAEHARLFPTPDNGKTVIENQPVQQNSSNPEYKQNSNEMAKKPDKPCGPKMFLTLLLKIQNKK